MLTADEASDIARRHGLSIADAVSLRALADDVSEAETVAAKFAKSDEQRFASALFAKSGSRRTEVGVDVDAHLGVAELFQK